MQVYEFTSDTINPDESVNICETVFFYLKEILYILIQAVI